MKRFTIIFTSGLLLGLILGFVVQQTWSKNSTTVIGTMPSSSPEVLFSDDLVQGADDLLASASAAPRVQAVAIGPEQSLAPQQEQVTPSTNGLLTAINEYRKGHGFNTLQQYNGLCEYSSSRKNEIINGSHGNFMQGNWQSYCPDCTYLGENLSFGYSDEQALSQWLGSDAHKVNIEGDWKFGCVSHFPGDIVVLSVGK